MTATKKIKYRGSAWLNRKLMKPVYGIQAYVNGAWLDASEGTKPLFFDTAEDRDAKLAELRKS